MQNSPQEKEKGWGGWSSWGKSLLSSTTSTVGMSASVSHPFTSSLPLQSSPLVCMCVHAGQSLTSVKTKAGEALRLRMTSVGEVQKDDEGAEGKKENEDKDPSGSGESSASAAASGRGVFSTITHAVQNTVSEHTHTLERATSLQNHVVKTRCWR